MVLTHVRISGNDLLSKLYPTVIGFTKKSLNQYDNSKMHTSYP